jgi:hypothetical protein
MHSRSRARYGREADMVWLEVVMWVVVLGFLAYVLRILLGNEP